MTQRQGQFQDNVRMVIARDRIRDSSKIDGREQEHVIKNRDRIKDS